MGIWLLLVDHTFQAMGQHFSVDSTSDDDNINTLKKKVKEKRPEALSRIHVDPSDLTVWRTMGSMMIDHSDSEHSEEILGSINVDNKDTIERLEEDELVANLGLSDGETLLVQLPDPKFFRQVFTKAVDTVPGLKEFQRYSKTLVTLGPSPSEGAKRTGYRKIQADDAQVIYDGQMASDSSLPTISPPIQIFHPIFDEFFRLANDEDVQPTVDDLRRVYRLMSDMSDIHRSDTEYSYEVLPQLRHILNAEVCEEQNPDGTRPDGVITLQIGSSRIAYFFLELKREIGEGNHDLTTEVTLNMRRSWIDKSREDIRQRCCCPTFLVTAGGPWLSVLGSVFTDKFIVQPLTDMRWMALSSNEEDLRVYYNARIFVALRRCLSKLKTFYESLDGAPPFVANQPHPRYFPYPSSFTTQFRYLKSLEEDAACVTYLAETLPNKCKVVVKFVSRYGKEVHEFLAREGYAPSLLYYGPLPETGLSGVFHRFPSSGLCLGSELMHMVVMDYIDAQPDTPHDVSAQIQTILTRLHSEGYVFGDLRKQNILFDTDGKVKLVDFNWCGRYDMNDADENLPDDVQKLIDQNKERIQAGDGPYDYVHYPLSMSGAEGIWAPGMQPFAPIRPIHDWMMFQRLSW